MAVLDNVEEYLEGKEPEAVTLFRRFEELVHRCGPCETAPRRTVVYWRRTRVWAGAYLEGGRLELNIDLLREAEHPLLLASFHTTKRVVTHRLRVTDPEQLDDSIEALLREAYEEVGPGTR